MDVMPKLMKTVSYQAELHVKKFGAINSNSALHTTLNVKMVLGQNFQHASKAALLQQAKLVINLLDVEKIWVMVLQNIRDGTKITMELFSIHRNRDAEKSNAHQPKKEFTKTLSKEDKQSLYEVNQDKASRFECNCNVEGECFWIHFNDETYGADINDGIELSCASWSEWSSEGQSCTRKKRAEVRECKQPNGDDGTPGVDCKGEGTRTKPCGRRLN